MKPKANSTNYNNLLLLLIPTFLLIVAWIGFTVYGNRVKSTISNVQSGRITPISPTFDLATIATLKTRDQISPIFTFQPPPSDESDSRALTTPSASESAISEDEEQVSTNETVPSTDSANLQNPPQGGTL